MDPLDELIDGLQERFPPNRVAIVLAALLSPIVAAGAAVATAWLLRHFPGLPQVSPGAVTTTFIAVFVPVCAGIIALAYKWLDGHQKREGARHAITTAIASSANPPGQAAQVILAGEQLEAPVADVSQGGTTHRASSV